MHGFTALLLGAALTQVPARAAAASISFPQFQRIADAVPPAGFERPGRFLQRVNPRLEAVANAVMKRAVDEAPRQLQAASSTPSASTTTYPLVATQSALPTNAASSEFPGLVTMPPSQSVTIVIYPGRRSIFAFPLYNYVSVDQEPDIMVNIVLDASASAPVSMVYSPLQWICDDYTWENWPLALDTCGWEGEGAPEGYSQVDAIAPGATWGQYVSSVDNSTMYPAYWYDGSALWFNAFNNGTTPAVLTMTAVIGAEPTPTPSASPGFNHLMQSPSNLPPGAISSNGLLSLQPTQSVNLWSDVYCLSYIEFPVAGTDLSRPIQVNVTALEHDLELWITPFNYVCPPQGYLNVPWWDSNCTWMGGDVDPDIQANFYIWDSISAGNTKTYDFFPGDPYMYPNGTATQSGLWFGFDALNWGEAALYTVTAGYSGTAASPPPIAPSPSSQPGQPSQNPAATSGSPGTGGAASNATALIGGAAGGGILVFALVVVSAYCLVTRRRRAAGGATKLQQNTGPMRVPQSRMRDLEAINTPRGLGLAASATGGSGGPDGPSPPDGSAAQPASPLMELAAARSSSSAGGGGVTVPPLAIKGSAKPVSFAPRPLAEPAGPISPTALRLAQQVQLSPGAQGRGGGSVVFAGGAPPSPGDAFRAGTLAGAQVSANPLASARTPGRPGGNTPGRNAGGSEWR